MGWDANVDGGSHASVGASVVPVAMNIRCSNLSTYDWSCAWFLEGVLRAFTAVSRLNSVRLMLCELAAGLIPGNS